MRDIARVFFLPDSKRPEKIQVLKLKQHLKNIKILVSEWDYNKALLDTHEFDFQKTKELLIKAAKLHDLGKTSTFQIKWSGSEFTYSFAGHRFEMISIDETDEWKRTYIKLLIKLHHSFSTEDITEAVAELKLIAGNNSEKLRLSKNFPLDLYALAMCDNIEPEVASYVFSGHASPRVFMEVEVNRLSGNRFQIYPFPFNKESILIKYEYAEIDVPIEILELIDKKKQEDAARDITDKITKANNLITFTKEVELVG